MDDNNNSQTMRAVLGLRGLIVDGVLRPGDRVSEPLLVEKFGVSRTPARAALVQTAAEGLIEPREKTGYVVRGYTEVDVFQGILIRGTLEGLGARYAAEREVPEDLLAALDACVNALDDVVYAEGDIDQSEYARLNDQFHALLLDCSGSAMVAWSMDRIRGLPFASPNAFVESHSISHGKVRRILQASQEQHRTIAQAIRDRDPVRAQAVTTEHSYGAAKYLQLLLTTDNVIPWVTDPPHRKRRQNRS